ncbi:MAG: site-2 protease family protein [Actinomycetota bacterium]
MFGNSWRLGRILGVEVRIDTSWAVIALLVSYSLYVRYATVYPNLRTSGAIALGVATAILFFGSVLTHELSHSLMARARNIPVKGITLFMFGGATLAKVESRGPWDEFIISVVGPLTSFGLAAVFGVIGMFGQDALPEPIAGVFGYLGLVNLSLGVFNLLPGFPLDGGRVLRSAVWKATNSLSQATRVAAIGGQIVGYGMVALGLFLLFDGAFAAGVWLGAIGWFLAQAAQNSYQELQIRRFLQGVEADDVMVRNLLPIPANISLQQAVDDYFMRHDHGAFPVQDGERTVGLLTLRAVKRVPREEWPIRRVAESMDPLGEQLTVTPQTPMDRVLGKLQQEEAQRVLVVDDGDVIGIITPVDVARWLQRRRAIEADRTSS